MYDGSGKLLRDMVIRVSGYQQSSLYPISADGLKDLLNSKGWIVEQVSNTSDSWFPGVSGFIYRVYAVVGTNYTDSEVTNQIRRDLDGYLSVSGVTIESGSYVPPSTVPVGNTHSANPQGGSSGIPPATVPNAGPSLGSSFVNNFAQGLGVSTPVALLGGGLILLLILKR